ncbi:hypothetical protein N431DRAFT_455173 [Stipitochalara longipes BDJ]|nr:hypothetical protein N431DRAFT_455173 [Stipitochalara longipes BDJ]
MTEEDSGSFSSFWQRSIDKVSSKTVKFMPNVTKPGNGKPTGEGDSSTLTQKQRRRAQVRKAQIEHRQRKENYVKHLEQDVINLREMIAQAETQSVLFKHENEAIKATLLSSSIPIPTIAPVPRSVSEQDLDITIPISLEQNSQSNFSSSGSPQNSQWQYNNSSSGSLVSMTFDEMIHASCLQITPPNNFVPDNDIFMTSPELFNIPSNPYAPVASSGTTPPSSFAALNPELSKPLPKLPENATAPVSQAVLKDLSTIAINFILALEHPCRTHFHAHGATFNPEGSPSGHELMASTLLYSHAPPSIFSSFNAPVPTSTTPPTQKIEWTAPSPELKQLYAMSQSLPKGDWEITPVQAWFLLMGRLGISTLVGDGGYDGGEEGLLPRLKKRLGKLVECFAFGAVMDEAKFWDAVESTMRGEDV